MSGGTLPLRATACPPAEEIAAFVAGMLDEAALASLDGHVATCRECRAVISALRPETHAEERPTQTIDAPVAGPALDVAALLAASRIGAVLGDEWRLERLLGTGGMGQVFEASHVVDGRRCAVKLLRPELAGHRELVRRFEREQHAVARIEHPAFVAVHATGTTGDGAPYFVMDLVEGQTLRAIVRARGPFAEDDVRQLGVQLLDALAAAHAAGVLHRDVKPDNLALEAGRLRVLDFGIARIVADAEASSAHGRTVTGQMLGTPAYMPPEQARALPAEIDERVDVFAAAATLAFLLTGRSIRSSTGALYEAMTSPVTPVARLAPGISAALASVLDRALAFDKHARFASAVEMKEALAASRMGGTAPAGGRRGVVVAGAVLVVGLVMGVVGVRRSGRADPPAAPVPSVMSSASVEAPRALPTEPAAPPLPDVTSRLAPPATSSVRPLRRPPPVRDPLERRQ